MYCICRSGHDEGYSKGEGDVWLHAKCRLVPRFVFDRITHMRVPYHAKSLGNVRSTATGHNYVTFHMEDGSKLEVVYYHPYPFKDSTMTEQRDVLYKFWQDLDACVDQISDPSRVALDQHESDKVRARTYAEVIAYLMHNFYEDANAVVREALARSAARKDGVTDHQTPGLGEALWDPRTRFDGTPYHAANEATVRSGGRSAPRTPRATGNRIPDGAVESWTKGISEGMFTVAQAANTYSMTEVEVKQQLGLA